MSKVSQQARPTWCVTLGSSYACLLCPLPPLCFLRHNYFCGNSSRLQNNFVFRVSLVSNLTWLYPCFVCVWHFGSKCVKRHQLTQKLRSTLKWPVLSLFLTLEAKSHGSTILLLPFTLSNLLFFSIYVGTLWEFPIRLLEVCNIISRMTVLLDAKDANKNVTPSHPVLDSLL